MGEQLTTRERARREAQSMELGRFLDHGTIQQFRAAARRLKIPTDHLVAIAWQPFDLPEGYVQLWFDSGFTCGISPEGEVSS